MGWVEPTTLLHRPQLLLSVWVFLQTLSHSWDGGGHVQLPWLHVEPPWHYIDGWVGQQNERHPLASERPSSHVTD